jgi:hypothetical protein
VFIHNKDELQSSRIHEETTIHSIKVNVTGLSASLGSRLAGAELERVSGELFASQRCLFCLAQTGTFQQKANRPDVNLRDSTVRNPDRNSIDGASGATDIRPGDGNSSGLTSKALSEQAKSLCQFVPKSCQHVINHQHHK